MGLLKQQPGVRVHLGQANKTEKQQYSGLGVLGQHYELSKAYTYIISHFADLHIFPPAPKLKCPY